MKSIDLLQPLSEREREAYEAGVQVGIDYARTYHQQHEGVLPIVSALFRDFAAELPTEAKKRLS